VGDERVAETWVGMRLKREEREIYLPLACPVELLRTIFVPNIVFCVQARRADARVS
jgi:hypothetical protein